MYILNICQITSTVELSSYLGHVIVFPVEVNIFGFMMFSTQQQHSSKGCVSWPKLGYGFSCGCCEQRHYIAVQFF